MLALYDTILALTVLFSLWTETTSLTTVTLVRSETYAAGGNAKQGAMSKPNPDTTTSDIPVIIGGKLRNVTHFIPEARVLVLPRFKLAFCYIEKNACTKFNELFNHINHLHLSPADTCYYRSTVWQFNLSLQNLTREKGWQWAVFLRDPAHRYFSAFASKCLQNEDIGINCLGAVGAYKKRPTETDVSWFDQLTLRNFNNQSALATNPHWANQSDFCGGLGDLSKYDFVGRLEGNVNRQVRKMLQAVGANETEADAFFPRSGAPGGHSSGWFADPSTFLGKPSTMNAIRNIYSLDYAMLGKPLQGQNLAN